MWQIRFNVDKLTSINKQHLNKNSPPIESLASDLMNFSKSDALVDNDVVEINPTLLDKSIPDDALVLDFAAFTTSKAIVTTDDGALGDGGNKFDTMRVLDFNFQHDLITDDAIANVNEPSLEVFDPDVFSSINEDDELEEKLNLARMYYQIDEQAKALEMLTKLANNTELNEVSRGKAQQMISDLNLNG